MSGVLRDAIDVRRFPWIRPLVGAYAHDFASVAPLFAGNPHDPAAWRDTIGRVQRANARRTSMAPVLAAQLAGREPPEAARRAAATLADPTTVAVVTGQQAGVFGGPLYTVLKAVTTIRLARMISSEHGVNAVPIFWVEAEDHDWNEIRSATVLDRDYAVASVAVAPVPGAGALPAARLTLGPPIAETVDALETILPPSEFSRPVLDELRRCYAPGRSMAQAFARWIEALLGPLGLVVFESSDPAAKPAAADLFARELEQPAETRGLVGAAADTLTGLGHAPQLQPADDHVGLFYLTADGRRAIKHASSGYQIGAETRSVADLAAEALAHPEHFSPNVVMRPLVQDRLFPTVCYVAGPSELAYQAQLGGVYRAFEVEPPLLYSRASATLLDAAALRFLERHGLALEALHGRDDSPLNRLLEDSLPPEIERILGDLDRAVGSRGPDLKQAVSSIDPTLAGAVDTTVDRMRETVRTLHGKIIQACKKKDDTLRRQFMRTRALAFPDGHPQERLLNVVFFANRYGMRLADRLLDVLPLETDKHYVLNL
jgi:bacillithiol biosynthesis cysteine-adding enzyme BshC